MLRARSPAALEALRGRSAERQGLIESRKVLGAIPGCPPKFFADIWISAPALLELSRICLK
jgi:hypothetical protein